MDHHDECGAADNPAQRKHLVRVYVKRKPKYAWRVVESFEPGNLSHLVGIGYFKQVGPSLHCNDGEELAFFASANEEDKMMLLVRRNKVGELVDVHDADVTLFRQHVQRN